MQCSKKVDDEPLPVCPCGSGAQDVLELWGFVSQMPQFLYGRGHILIASRFLEETEEPVRSRLAKEGSMAYLIEEVIEEFDADEQCRRVCKFLSNHVQERFGTHDVVGWPALATFRLQRLESEFQYAYPIYIGLRMFS